MKPRDIFGNLVYNGAGNVITVTPEIVNDFIRKAIGITPIPLTEEWLEKFHFIIGGYDFLFWKKESFEIAGADYLFEDTPDIPEWAFTWKDLNGESQRVIISYVHQLQNLHYALTGQELTPNTPKT